jgi:CheY-like chemotaxis protein/two-component sensor histidine kinase
MDVDMSVATERRQGDSNLVQKIVEVERANQNKSQFLAVASHDLRQPIHALGLYIAELRRKVSGVEQQHLLGQVERSVDALSTLIEALLDISQLDAGVIVPQKQVFDLSELFSRIAADFKMAAKIKNICLVVRPVIVYVYTDPVLLERILVNLVSNAVRYTRPFGSVLLGCRRRGQQVHIEVQDNGIGIPEDMHARIFCEFIQLNQDVVNCEKGLGLGLAIVDRLVKLLGHHIELRSAPYVGSLFTVKLALARKPLDVFSMQTDLLVDAELLSCKKILIVDGDLLVLDGTAMILSSWGYQVTAVTTLAAVQKRLAEGENWDLVISDYQLDRGATGLDVSETVRQHCGMPTPCILISGDTSAMVQKMADGAGLHLLHKPVKPAKLRSLVQYHLKEVTH